MDSGFAFGRWTRFAFGLENPNDAACLLLSVLPFIWGTYELLHMRCRAFQRQALLGIEGTILTALLLTYSRGAAMGLAAALCGYAWGAKHTLDAASWRDWRRDISWKYGLAVVIASLIGFGARTLASINDASVLNRLPLWRGAAVLFAIRPSGWGGDQSGLCFGNWVQAPESGLAYSSAVNTFMTLAVEHGALFLCLWVLICISSCIGVFLAQGASARLLKQALLASGAAGMGFSVAAIFNTFDDVYLCIPASLAGFNLIAALGIVGWRRYAMLLVAEGVISIALVLGLMLLGRLFATSILIGIDARELPEVELRWSASSECHRTVEIAPDLKVFGPYFGKAIRRGMVSMGQSGVRYVVHPTTGKIPEGTHDIVLLGDRITDSSAYMRGHVTIVCPVGDPPLISDGRFNSENSIVYLPEFDELRSRERWVRWAQTRSIRVVILKGVGQDISGDVRHVSRVLDSW